MNSQPYTCASKVKLVVAPLFVFVLFWAPRAILKTEWTAVAVLLAKQNPNVNYSTVSALGAEATMRFLLSASESHRCIHSCRELVPLAEPWHCAFPLGFTFPFPLIGARARPGPCPLHPLTFL